jgi:hypothetical protein
VVTRGAHGVRSEEFLNALWYNTCIEHLDLSWNTIGSRGASCIGWSLRFNSTLVTLDLTHNDIGLMPVVKVDAFFLNYLATKTMKLELLQSCGGMDFKPMAACHVQFRPLLDTLSNTATPAMSGKPESPSVELTADMVSISGGGGKNQPLIRSVIGSVTYRLRFRHPATQAIQLIQDRLAAHSGRSTISAPPSSSGSGAHAFAARELCVQVKGVSGLKSRTADTAPAPYVHYRLLDFPDHLWRIIGAYSK